MDQQSHSRDRLIPAPSQKTRRAVVYLDPGRHLFRYVTADGRWFNDPAVETEGENCVLVVPAP